MNLTQAPAHLIRHSNHRDGFVMLHDCHQQTLFTLNELERLISQLEKIAHPQGSPNANMKAMSTAIAHHFSHAEPQHHEDEERHIFSKLALSDSPDIVRAVLKLQEDHDNLEEEWMEISAHIDTVACGHVGYDLTELRQGAAVFSALLRNHIELEEACIYPYAQARLSLGEKTEMSLEMSNRRRAHRETRRLFASR
jgi:hemerythrin-like domain-containing protein